MDRASQGLRATEVDHSKPRDPGETLKRISALRNLLKTRISFLFSTSLEREGHDVPCFQSLPASGEVALQALRSNFGEYNYRQVEALLNQSADLLDRCLRDRAEWNSLRSRLIYLHVELNRELMDLLEMYDVVQAQIHKTPQFIHAEMKKSVQDNLSTGKDTYAQVQDSYGDAKDTYDRKSGASFTAKASSQNVTLQIREATAKLATETRQEADCDTSIRLTEQRLAVAFENMEAKLRAILDDGPLDYCSQIVGLRRRIERDFGDAVLRLKAAAVGLEHIYRFSSFRNSPFQPSDPLEAIILWQRNAIAWLVAFAQNELSATRVFSVRSAAREQWEEALRSGTPPYHFSIATPFDDLWGMRNLRVRGVSLVILGGGVRSVWSGVLIPPSKGVYQAPKDGDDKILDQTDLNKCTFGRIQSNDSPREVEVLGQVSWVNISPISADGTFWQLTLAPVSTQSAIKDIEDVHIEMHYSGVAYA